jgi:hypothetical protein
VEFAGATRVLYCIVSGCTNPIRWKLHDGCYGRGLSRFCGVTRKAPTRRAGDARILLCDFHLQTDPRADGLQWEQFFDWYA